MIQLFRNFFKSKIGLGITLGFVVLIGLAFGLTDVGSTGTFGGVAGGDRAALVGDRRIDTSDLSMNATNSLDRLRQQDPTMTMEGFIASGGLNDMLATMVSRNAIAELGREYGLRAGNRLVDSEIRQAPEFRALDGGFDTEAFRNALRQRGLSEELVRDDLAMGLYARQLLTPITRSPQMPRSVAQRYARLLQERRSGTIASVQAAAYAPDGDASDEQLRTYYDENRSNYIRPERRVIRYATFGEDALGDLPAPSAAQIEGRYQRDIAEYSERETRSFTQLVVPTQAAAQAIVEEVRGGMTLDRSAREKGLATSRVVQSTQEELAAQTSTAVAAAAFAAGNGAVSAPAQGDLGWYVLRVDSVERQAGRSLAQVRNEIVAELAVEQRRRMLNETTAELEDELASGRSLSEVAEQLGLEIQSTRPLTAAGQVYGTQQSAPQVLARVLDFAFELEENDPEIAEVVPGETFLVFDVADITRSATAPFNEIRDDLETAWRLDEGMKTAGTAANRIMARVSEGSSLREAIAAEDVNLPAPESVSLGRQEVAQMGQLPPALALFFSMAEGTVKRLESDQTQGWFVIELDDVTAPEVAADDPIVLSTRNELSGLLAEEYTAQFVRAAENAVDIDINQVAVDAVADQLTGRTN